MDGILHNFWLKVTLFIGLGEALHGVIIFPGSKPLVIVFHGSSRFFTTGTLSMRVEQLPSFRQWVGSSASHVVEDRADEGDGLGLAHLWRKCANHEFQQRKAHSGWPWLQLCLKNTIL